MVREAGLYCAICDTLLYRGDRRNRWWCAGCEVWVNMSDAALPPVSRETRRDIDLFGRESFTQLDTRVRARDAVRNLHLVRPWEEPWEYHEEVVTVEGVKVVPKEGPLGQPSSTGLGYLTGGFRMYERSRTRKGTSTSAPSITDTTDGATASRTSAEDTLPRQPGMPSRRKKSPSLRESVYLWNEEHRNLSQEPKDEDGERNTGGPNDTA